MPNNPWSDAEIAMVKTHVNEGDRAISERLRLAGYNRAPRAVEAFRKLVLGIIHTGPVSTWTDERVEKLREAWKEGLSASLIAKRLGGITRNAVIGKANRLNLSGGSTRVTAGREASKVLRRQRSNAESAARTHKHSRRIGQPIAPFISESWNDHGPIAPTVILQLGETIESVAPKVWTERGTGECAFPVGLVEGTMQLSCCNKTDATYCAPHAGLAFRGRTQAQKQADKKLFAYIQKRVA